MEAAGDVVTSIKVCGLTRASDVELCRALGAGYLGFNFSARSPRRVDAGRLPELLAASGDTRRVGVFVDEPAHEVRQAVAAMKLDAVQVHRELAASDLELGCPVIAVAHVSGGAAKLPEPSLLLRCRAVLFDTADGARPGGTGVAFDWSVLAGLRLPVPVGIAGGLNAGNVGRAIAAAHPDFVDVASGVESSPGVKDPLKIRAFFAAVADAA
jgi:phosphoribosylanthranilate isomerase